MRQYIFRNLMMLLGLGSVFCSPSRAQTPYQFETIRNVPYHLGNDASPAYQNLDIHRPKGCKDYPVMFFVHGGGWTFGNKDQFGIYTALARTLAAHGIGTVSINYRLSPQVKHPEHIRDVARAFAWTYRNIASYGGDPNELFAAGHSAGGHLVSLLATDKSYLQAEGLTLGQIRGVISISGVLSLPLNRQFESAFGSDPTERRLASPLAYVNDKCPPFLIFHADNDLLACDGSVAQAFAQALENKHCSVQLRTIASRNHFTIILGAVRESDPVMQDMLSFMTSQVVADRVVTSERSAVFARFLAGD